MSTIAAAEAAPKTIDISEKGQPTPESKPFQLPKPDPKIVNDPTREKFALAAFREIVKHQLETKYDFDQVQTQTWRFADAAMRGKAVVSRSTIAVSGIVGDAPPPSINISEAMIPAELPPIDEIK